MLFQGGCVDVFQALVEAFNQQMAGALIGVIEERSLPPAAYAKLKAWVDSPTIAIRAMRENQYTLSNYCAFIQTSNSRDACPIEAGDQRIIVIRVPPLTDPIPWHEVMEPALRREASDFLGSLLAMKLPPAAGRLHLPILTTPDKLAMMKFDRDAAVAAVVPIIDEWHWWCGTSSRLLAELGQGPWPTDPSALSKMFDDEVAQRSLRERGISFGRGPRSKDARSIFFIPEWVEEFCRRCFSN
jgi:hypothetical protein